MIDMQLKGIGWTDIALLLNRVAVGTFVTFSGYQKLFNAQRLSLGTPRTPIDPCRDVTF